jgi:hypothetical protein
MTNTTKTKLTAAFIALSLCVTWFYFSRAVALGNSKNTITPTVFAIDVRGGGMIIRPLREGTNPGVVFLPITTTNDRAFYRLLPKVWQARFAGAWLARHLLESKIEPLHMVDTNGAAITGLMVKPEPFRDVFGLYQAAWLMLTFIALICFVENPAFIILAVFAGTGYTLTPTNDITMFPWHCQPIAIDAAIFMCGFS